MTVESHLHPVLLRVLVHPRRYADGPGRGDAFCAERFSHLKSALHFSICEVISEAVVVTVKQDAGVLELLSDLVKSRERNLQAPLSKLFPAHFGRFQVRLREFALAESDRPVSFDCRSKRTITERIALRSDLDAADNGVDSFAAGERFAPHKHRRRTADQKLAYELARVSAGNQSHRTSWCSLS